MDYGYGLWIGLYARICHTGLVVSHGDLDNNDIIFTGIESVIRTIISYSMHIVCKLIHINILDTDRCIYYTMICFICLLTTHYSGKLKCVSILNNSMYNLRIRKISNNILQKNSQHHLILIKLMVIMFILYNKFVYLKVLGKWFIKFIYNIHYICHTPHLFTMAYRHTDMFYYGDPIDYSIRNTNYIYIYTYMHM